MGGVVGTFVALSTILGSGTMILPGTSYHQLGRWAWLPWVIAACSVIPLLYCYAWLGRRHPSASGLAHYAEVALGAAVGRAAGLLAVFALVAGIPATALTGGRYLATFAGEAWLRWLFPVAVLAVATVVACVGATVSAKLQVALILALFVVVSCTAVVAIGSRHYAAPSAQLPKLGALGRVLTAVYVAFTGWETVAFTFEEHKRPELIPRIFAASYVAVVALYALLLFGLFSATGPADRALSAAPLLVLAERSLSGYGRPVTLVLVLATVTANLFASVLALSRLVFGLARSGYLPAALARMRKHDGNPVAAVLAVGGTLGSITILAATGLVGFEVLFVFSGGVYFVLYGLGAACFGKLADERFAPAITATCGLIVLAVTVLAGPAMWLCWALFALVWLTVRLAAAAGREPAVGAVLVTERAGSDDGE